MGRGQELPRMELVWADGARTRAGSASGWAAASWGGAWREVAHHHNRQLWRYGLEDKPRGLQVLPRPPLGSWRGPWHGWVSVARLEQGLGAFAGDGGDHHDLYSVMSRLMLGRLAHVA